MSEKSIMRVGLGIVGAGAICKTILPILKTDPCLRLVAITDLLPSAAQFFCDQIPALTPALDLEALLKNPEIDLLYLATPPHLHEQQIQAILKAGKSVIGEKPWVTHMPQAIAVATTAQAYPKAIVASCSSRFRFTKATQATEKLLQQKTLGRLRTIKITATLGLPKPIEALPPWKQKPGLSGGGIAADWSVYELDWLIGVLGNEFHPRTVTSWFDDWKREGSGLESGYEVRIECASGLTVNLLRRSEIGPTHHQIEIRGESGGLDIPFAPDATLTSLQQHLLQPDGKIKSHSVPETTPEWQTLLVGPILNAAEALAQGSPVASNPESQIRLHQCLDAIYQSACEHQPVKLS